MGVDLLVAGLLADRFAAIGEAPAGAETPSGSMTSLTRPTGGRGSGRARGEPGPGLAERFGDGGPGHDAAQLGPAGVHEPDPADPQAVLQAFVNAGATRIFYNHPRFIAKAIGGVTVQFSPRHFIHMHFNIASPTAQAAHGAANNLATPDPSLLFAALSLPSVLENDRGARRQPGPSPGLWTPAAPSDLYRFEIGDPDTAYGGWVPRHPPQPIDHAGRAGRRRRPGTGLRPERGRRYRA